MTGQDGEDLQRVAIERDGDKENGRERGAHPGHEHEEPFPELALPLRLDLKLLALASDPSPPAPGPFCIPTDR